MGIFGGLVLALLLVDPGRTGNQPGYLKDLLDLKSNSLFMFLCNKGKINSLTGSEYFRYLSPLVVLVRSGCVVWKAILYSVITIFFFTGNNVASSALSNQETGSRINEYMNVVLADFEKGIPCSDEGDSVGFRRKDRENGKTIEGGAEGSETSCVFKYGPGDDSVFFQGNVRRKYLATRSTKYIQKGPNTLSFWLKIPSSSFLINRVEQIGDEVLATIKKTKNTLGVWTYHWRYGDMGVGGPKNVGIATDSMMHGYSNFSFNRKAAGKWVNVVLSPSAFQQCRDYFRFYAARGTTDDLGFFTSLRQMQFKVFPKLEKGEGFQVDQIKLIYKEPKAIFEKDFFRDNVSVSKVKKYAIPVVIENHTKKDRSYRVFISSFLGVKRELLNRAFSLTDSLAPMREMQRLVHGNGGVGAVELMSEDGKSIIKDKREVFINAGGNWKGELIHYIKPEMLGEVKEVGYSGFTFYPRRDTLTTSVIVWDPQDYGIKDMDYIDVEPDNSDDGIHPSPPGFPKQCRPPEGWRSEDIPLSQVGGYFVSVIHLEE